MFLLEFIANNSAIEITFNDVFLQSLHRTTITKKTRRTAKLILRWNGPYKTAATAARTLKSGQAGTATPAIGISWTLPTVLRKRSLYLTPPLRAGVVMARNPELILLPLWMEVCMFNDLFQKQRFRRILPSFSFLLLLKVLKEGCRFFKNLLLFRNRLKIWENI